MNIKTIVVGPLQTNCYIVEKGNYCLIIDPGAEAENIIAHIDKRVVGVIVTHTHDDHIGALNDIINKYQTRVYNMQNMPEGNFALENFLFEVIHTPGHKEDELTIYFKEEKVMFVGDFIFNGGIGRTDLPGASAYDMKLSIKKILNYPHDVTLYPGHYASTTLGNEINNLNYFLNII